MLKMKFRNCEILIEIKRIENDFKSKLRNCVWIKSFKTNQEIIFAKQNILKQKIYLSMSKNFQIDKINIRHILTGIYTCNKLIYDVFLLVIFENFSIFTLFFHYFEY